MKQQAPPPPKVTWEASALKALIAAGSKLSVPVPCSESSAFLVLEFQVNKGSFIDFEVMLETDDESYVSRLYGPSRRASSVRTCLPLPHSGTAYAIFDNFSSWFTSVELSYSLQLTETAPDEQITFSRLARGNHVVGTGVGEQAEEEARRLAAEQAAEAELKAELADAREVELLLKPGQVTCDRGRASSLFPPHSSLARPSPCYSPAPVTPVLPATHPSPCVTSQLEEIDLTVGGRTPMYVSVEVVRGRDVDFGIMFVADDDGDGGGDQHPGASGEAAQDEVAPIRLFGPCRRASNLTANLFVPSPGRVVLGFDNSGSWFSSKTLRYRVRTGEGAHESL
jgi:hypothetical protein